MTRPACVLAIEASVEQASVALAHEHLVTQQRLPDGAPVAEAALAMIDQLLAERAVALDAVDAYAFASGPGAFTSLRVACGLMQGLAFARNRPVIAVGSLRALAFAASRSAAGAGASAAASAAGAGHGRVMAAVDARMRQVYWGVYQPSPWREVAAPALADPEELEALVAHWQPQVIAGNALRAFERAWPASFAAVRLPLAAADAAIVAELACADFDQGAGSAARDAAPQYVRNQVALTVAQRQAS